MAGVAPQQAQALAQAIGVNPMSAQAAVLAQQNQQLAEMLQATQQQGRTHSSTLGALAANLGADFFNQKNLNANQKQLAQAQIGSKQAIAAQLFPGTDADSQRMRLAYFLDPQSVTSNISKLAGPNDMRGGNTMYAAGTSAPVTAPVINMDGGQASIVTPQGVQSLGQRPMNYGESTAAAAQAETARNNQVNNQLGQGQLTVAQQQAAAAAAQARAAGVQAGASAQTSNVGAANSPNFSLPPGYVIKGP